MSGIAPRPVRRDRRRNRRDMIGRVAAAAADDIYEAALANFADQAAPYIRGFSSYWPNSLADRRSDRRRPAYRRRGRCSAICARKSSAPSAQLKADRDRPGVAHRIPRTPPAIAPTAGGPDLSVMVPDIITGTSSPRASAISAIAYSAALALRVSKNGFHQQQVGAAVQEAIDLLAISRAQIVEGDGAVTGGFDTSGEIDAVRLVGPIAPATKRRSAVLGR